MQYTPPASATPPPRDTVYKPDLRLDAANSKGFNVVCVPDFDGLTGLSQRGVVLGVHSKFTRWDLLF